MTYLVSCFVLTLLDILFIVVTILYAVHKKGDVTAELSFLPFTFTLQTKECTPSFGANRDRHGS